MSKIPNTNQLFDLNHSLASELLSDCKYPYEALSRLDEYIKILSRRLDRSFREISSEVFAPDDAKIMQGAIIEGPAIIGHRTEIRPGAFIRKNVIIGDDSVIGNSSEVKSSIIFDGAKLPHYNYVGDSIIGYRAHMGAGSIASNLRLDKENVDIFYEEERLYTGLRKVGVFLGDGAEVGCGCVICPGTVIGKEAIIYPLTMVRGVVPSKKIYKGIER